MSADGLEMGRLRRRMRGALLWALPLLVAAAQVEAQPAFNWAAAAGGSSGDTGYAAAVDFSGNVYTTGSFWGTVDFDPGPATVDLSSAGDGDVFVQKLDRTGALVWAVAIGGTQTESGRGIAVDGSGNVYVTGRFMGTADFDPGAGVFHLTSTGGQFDPVSDVFVLKLDGNGDFLWATRTGAFDDDRGYAVAVDATGNVYTTGQFGGTVDFDPGMGTTNLTSAGARDVFIQKLDSTGQLVWAVAMGGDLADAGSGVAVDGTGNVYATGSFVRIADFDPGPGTFNLTSFGGMFDVVPDIFVVKLNGSGALVWAMGVGGAGIDSGAAVGLDGTGNVYTTGFFEGTVDFDPGVGTSNLTSAGSRDGFVQKLNSAGTLVWAGAMGGTGLDMGEDLAVDGSGDVYTTGLFEGTADFDPSVGTANRTSSGSFDVFVQKLDSTGAYAWTAAIGSTGIDRGNSVAVDAAGNVHTTGSFEATVDFDPGAGTANQTSQGSVDVFVQKLGSAALPPEVAISHAESADPVAAGSGVANLSYVVTATNNGEVEATGLEVSETLTLPAGVVVESVTPSGSTTIDGETSPIAWTVGNLAEGATETLTVALTVGAGTAAGTDVVSGMATVSALDQTDPSSSNDSASSSTSVIVNRDYGDAPDPSYPTLGASGGASHDLPSALFLGAVVDVDPGGQPTVGADGDDNDAEGDDDDGVLFTSPLRLNVGSTSTDVSVTAAAAGKLQGWVDFNADGDWTDTSEQVFTDVDVVIGVNALSFGVPASSVLGPTYARFRVSSTAGLGFGGSAADGEVEDYQVQIIPDLAIDLFSMDLVEDRAFLACDSITAGGDFMMVPDLSILAPAKVTFHAGGQVALKNGLLVAEGAELTVRLGAVPGCP